MAGEYGGKWRRAGAAAAAALDYTTPLRSARGAAERTPFHKLSCELSKESLRIPGAVPFNWEHKPGIPAPPKPTLAALFRVNNNSPAPSVCNVPIAAAGHPPAAPSTIHDHDDEDDASSIYSRATSEAITANGGALSAFDDSHSFACSASAATTQLHFAPAAGSDAKDSIMYRFLPAAQAIASDTPSGQNGGPGGNNSAVGTSGAAAAGNAPARMTRFVQVQASPPPLQQQQPHILGAAFRRPVGVAALQHISVLGGGGHDDYTDDDFFDDYDAASSEQNNTSARSCGSSLLSFIRIRNAFHFPASPPRSPTGNHRHGNSSAGLRSAVAKRSQFQRSSSRRSGAGASPKTSAPRKHGIMSCNGLCSDSSNDVCITAISSPLPPARRMKDVFNDSVVFQHPPKPMTSFDVSDASSCCSAYDTPTTFCNSPAAPTYCGSTKSYVSCGTAHSIGSGTAPRSVASETDSPAPEPTELITNVHSEATLNQAINEPILMLNDLNLATSGQRSSPNYIWSKINGHDSIIQFESSPSPTASTTSSTGRLAPPLPKSPTQSWLHGRTNIPLVNVRSPSRFSQMHRAGSSVAPSPLAHVIKYPSVLQPQSEQQQQQQDLLYSKWEALVKESHGSQPGHLRFSEELLQQQDHIPSVQISV